MKGIVVELDSKYAYILDKNGCFVKVSKKPNYEIGTEITIPQSLFVIPSYARNVAIAALMMFMIGIGYYSYSYNLPDSYVSIDIDPSIEITINRYDRVLSAIGLNSDGQIILSGISLKNKKTSEGVEIVLEKLSKSNYFSNSQIDENNSDTKTLVINVSSDNTSIQKNIENQITEITKKEFAKNQTDTKLIISETSTKKHEQAKNLSISTGKLLLIEEAIKENNTLTVDELKTLPVKELVKINKKPSAEHKNSNESNPSEVNSTQITPNEVNHSEVKPSENVTSSNTKQAPQVKQAPQTTQKVLMPEPTVASKPITKPEIVEPSNTEIPNQQTPVFNNKVFTRPTIIPTTIPTNKPIIPTVEQKTESKELHSETNRTEDSRDSAPANKPASQVTPSVNIDVKQRAPEVTNAPKSKTSSEQTVPSTPSVKQPTQPTQPTQSKPNVDLPPVSEPPKTKSIEKTDTNSRTDSTNIKTPTVSVTTTERKKSTSVDGNNGNKR